MGDVASSVLARLKNKAKESGRSYQLCLQLFCQEEFLRRLEKSKYVDNLVLKGGLFIYSLTEFDSRVTVDIDFLLKRIPNTPEQLRKVVEEIIAVETGNDFVTFEIKDVVIEKFTGKIIAVVHRNDDVEEKWVVAPAGMTFTKEEIRGQIHFQEKYFDSEIVM